MVTEVAIFGAISVSWGFTKDIYTFISRVKQAGEDIQGLDTNSMNSVLLLGRYFRFFAPEENSHLQVVIGQIKASAQRQAKYSTTPKEWQQGKGNVGSTWSRYLQC
jgi:hypothetical protein